MLRNCRAMIRQHRYLPAVAAALAAVMCGACAGPAGPSGPDGTALTLERIGGTWTLVTLTPQGQAEAAPPAGAISTIQVAGGRAAVRADCNRCNGPAAVGAGTLTVGPPLACTRAFCASAPFDDTFLRMLAGESAATLDGDTLTLGSDRGVLRFRR
jgi:heat shock protein HslJ